ncbi:MAG: YidC/Oxa1 family insertase periplasmic-domain containing protein, partial [Deltaproteobacteria bacterium]
SMKVDLTFRNLGKQARTVNYILQGPTGLPLENVENTQKFRDVVVGFETGPGKVAHELMAGKTVADGKGEEWKQPVKYIGTDIQFFAALVCPVPDQLQAPYTKSIRQQLIGLNLKEKSEISVQLTSVDLQLEGAGAAEGKDAVTHEYRLFAGPKRDDVLPEDAKKVIDFGMFHWISRPMLGMLKIFYSVFGSWGIAIICLTIVVRTALFPLSIRQARGAAKMQALQPEIAALKEKYGNDKEKLARAQMELFRKHKYNPAAGCLPVFLQLPIFMGLYQALNHAVDLRMASFLWIGNLAAPDALFRMPFAIPFLGQEFNLLPLITIVLFVVQQKMFMPPPANEEQAMQQKMMNFMMVFMGVMFYKVPAGLCVYFIASSLWGMGERKLLPKVKPGAPTGPPPADPSQGRRKAPPSDDGESGGGGGLWAMLLKAAEKETSARRSSSDRRK